MKYRSEIDGLRAFAVIPVILFHAGFELFSGGFVGVDIFFVISGYLITTFLFEDIENNRFSTIGFYERRARRIFPALFFLILLCIPFAWMWMLPNQFKDFSKSLIAVSLFSSNILFWKESGYFDTAAEEKPLLHTWSLAVEEQYYVFFPIILMFAWRFGKNRVFWMIVVMAAFSLLLSEWGWRNQPAANFYLAPTRAWELLAGSIAAFIAQKRGVQKSDVLSLIGLAAIIFSIFTYDRYTPFPSIYTLVPVVGVVLLVLFAEKETIAARILSAKVFIGVGLISYSAYLWHQPLFAFARVNLIEEPSAIMMAALSLLSILLGYLSWRYIERPFRDVRKISRIYLLVFSAVGVVFFILLGLLGVSEATQGLLAKKTTEIIKNFGDYSYAGDNYRWIDLQESPKYLLVGDSHARQYLGALREKFSNVSMFAESACISIPNIINEYKNLTTQRADCINLYKKYLQYLDENPSIHTVIFASRWDKNLFDIPQGIIIGRVSDSNHASHRFEEEMNSLLKLITVNNRKVLIIGNVPSAHVSGENMQKGYIDCVLKFGENSCQKSYSDKLREGVKFNSLLKSIARNNKNVKFYDPTDSLCSDGICFVVKDGNLLYSDHAHLTNFGSRLVIGKME